MVRSSGGQRQSRDERFDRGEGAAESDRCAAASEVLVEKSAAMPIRLAAARTDFTSIVPAPRLFATHANPFRFLTT
jgi:hypothetical protein